MKLYIHEPGILIDKPCWTNFKRSTNPNVWFGDELKRMYSANLVINRLGEDPHIEFENESDATFFLLRWS